MKDAAELTALAGSPTALVSDCLDDLGIRNNVMDRRIRPITNGFHLVGRAVTVLMADVDDSCASPTYDFSGEIGLIRRGRPGDVFVVSTAHGGFWGEDFADAAHQKGVAGIVCDAWTRNVAALRAAGHKVFVAGISPQDCPGRMEYRNHGVPIECGGVRVQQNDVVIGDDDGVVVIPRDAVGAVIRGLAAKRERAARHRRVLAEGGSLSDLFQTYLGSSG